MKREGDSNILVTSFASLSINQSYESSIVINLKRFEINIALK